MADDFKDIGPMLDSPAENAAVVTPHDSTDLGFVTRALWVGVLGDVSVEMKGVGSAIVHKGVQGRLDVRCTRVNDTGTDATDIVAWW